MNVYYQLFVRACKSKEPYTRLRSVYRRFYLAQDNIDIYLANFLSDICDEYLDYPVNSLINDLNPSSSWKFGIDADDSYYTKVVKILCSKIRLSKVDKFKGLRRPAVFRNAA
jgi:hypothetical protein